MYVHVFFVFVDRSKGSQKLLSGVNATLVVRLGARVFWLETFAPFDVNAIQTVSSNTLAS